MATIDIAVQYLAERMVAPELAAHNHLNVVDNAQEIDESFHPRAALTLPYFDEHGAYINFTRVRYFDPPIMGGVRKRALRYQQPEGTAPEVYLPMIPGHDWAATMADPSKPIAITEGEIKSMSAMFHTGVPFAGLGGVFNWADNKVPLPWLMRTEWKRREVFIVFDSDISTNQNVQLAEARLVSFLKDKYAKVRRVRLDPGEEGAKMGADDLIAARGADALINQMRQSDALGALDMKILEMNEKAVYLEEEDKVFVVGEEKPITKSGFTAGHSLSAIDVQVMGGNGQMKNVQVARAWLTHDLARRYRNTIFKPGEDELIRMNGGVYLNSWREQPCKEGDVSHFLDLTQYLFEPTMQDTTEGWDWPIKLLAYKAQNQMTKFPLSIMLIGDQGSGKSLWAKMVTGAFGEYGKTKNSGDLDNDYNAWIESCLVAVVDDVDPGIMYKKRALLRAWISEPRIERHQKYLNDREVDNLCFLIFTSNFRNAGAFAHDDRRMLVVGAPPKMADPDAYYQPIWDWVRSGDAFPAIYHYLLNYDLQGWTPPATAPLTADKVMSSEESMSEFGILARDMREADYHVVERWLQNAEMWCQTVIGQPGHADANRANDVYFALSQFPIRPWYTAEELTKIFPHMIEHLPKYTGRSSASELSLRLRNESIDYLRNKDDPKGFMWKGRRQQFLIVNYDHGIPKRLTQAEFDQYMSVFGTYQMKSAA